VLLALIPCSMDLGDEFNNFILNELIDSSSSHDEDNFYCDVVNIVFETLLNELIHRGSIVGRRAVDRKRLSWHALLYHDYFFRQPNIWSRFF
jgi:hypothetical protein